LAIKGGIRVPDYRKKKGNLLEERVTVSATTISYIYVRRRRLRGEPDVKTNKAVGGGRGRIVLRILDSKRDEQ